MTRYHRAARAAALACVAWLALVSRVQAQAAEVDDEQAAALHARVTAFFDGVSGSGASGGGASGADVAKAFETLLKESPLASPLRKKTVDALVAETKTLERKYGKYRSAERFDVKPVGKDVLVMRYLYKCERFPVVWHFTFYRDPGGAASDKWFVITVSFNTDVELLGM